MSHDYTSKRYRESGIYTSPTPRPCIPPPPGSIRVPTGPERMPIPANLEPRRTGVVARADLLATAQPERLQRVTANAKPGRCHECRRVGGSHKLDCSKRTTDRVEET